MKTARLIEGLEAALLKRLSGRESLATLVALLRWDKPSGRLILLIPAGWALWLGPATASPSLVLQVLVGGLAVSGAGCIANDLWDQSIDSQVERTRSRPLASGAMTAGEAWVWLLLALGLSLLSLLSLPHSLLCLALALAALPLILLYPSAKRVFALPQLLLALTWGFAVLLPWAAANGTLLGQPQLPLIWLATVCWACGFDTVYALADLEDDSRIGVHSSARTLGSLAPQVVTLCHGATLALAAAAAWWSGVGLLFWPCWLLACVGMERESRRLLRMFRKPDAPPRAFYTERFAAQVKLGGLLLLGLVLGRLSG